MMNVDLSFDIDRMLRHSLRLSPSEIRLILERLADDTPEPRMSPSEFRDTVAALGFASPQRFAEAAGIPQRTIETWLNVGLSDDAAKLLMVLRVYLDKVREAVGELKPYLATAGLPDQRD